ncbi:MAG: ATP-binding protein [Acidobacteriota bacterium]
MASRELLIGATVASGGSAQVRLEADALTTHGVVLGMTGSGKTGLAVVILEELARQHVPLLICDLKGDLTNLLLTFPNLRPEDFAPYLPASVATADRSRAAAETADRWRAGLTKWSLGEAEIRQVRDGVAWRLLTPGSGVAPVNLLPALDPPAGYDPDVDPDGARTRLDGTAAGLLALVDRGGDPLSDRDHVLVATLLDHAWRAGSALDFAGLIRQVADPPVPQFGVLDAESFYPRKERSQLVMAFNTVLASPGFVAWTRGVPLAIPELVGSAQSPRASILYLAHLADRERLSFLTLLFSSLLSWTRSQPGSESLRVLLYLDEVQGILPPTAVPPTKPPLLTLLKQGRAFGTGVLLATQNPVDLDYKALGNIGLKLVGHLDTENDRRHALQGLDVAGSDLESTVAALKPREFLLAGARAGSPGTIASRWAMSYLRGPLTLAELKPLAVASGAGAGAPVPAPATATRPDTRPVLSGVPQLFGVGDRLAPHVLLDAEVVYRKVSPSIERRLTGSWCAPLAADRIAWEGLREYDATALSETPTPTAQLAALPGNAEELLHSADKGFMGEMDSRAVEVLFHRGLGLVQGAGEGAEAFRARCQAAAPAGTPKERALRDKYEKKLRALDDKLAKERLDLARDEQDLAARDQQEKLTLATGVGETLLSGLGALLGGRRGIGGAVRRGASTARQVSEKQRMKERARAEVDESQQTIAALEAEKQRVAAELETALAALRQGPDGGGEETLRLTPARKDIAVRRVALAWLPEG